jgi:hypothetical protein
MVYGTSCPSYREGRGGVTSNVGSTYSLGYGIETGGCGAYRGIRGLGVSMNRRNERRVTIVDRSGGRVDQTVTVMDYCHSARC